MKKIFLILAVLSLSLASCKKDYTCVCTGTAFIATVTTKTEAKSSKKAADAWCKGLENGTETEDGQPNSTLPLTCAIK